MLRSLALSLSLATALVVPAVAADPAGAPPWQTSFTTQVRGSERTFVAHAGRTYLLATPADFTSGLANDQDVAITAKLRRLPGGKLGLYRIDLLLETDSTALNGVLDGDNVHLLAACRERHLLVHQVIPAASDAQLLAARQAGIPEDDWDRRLAVLGWIHEQAKAAGNADFWNNAAETLLTAIINDMASQAGGDRRDVQLLRRAVDLAVQQLKDPGVAARIAAAPWLREHGGAGAEGINRLMRSLGYEFYKDAWLVRAEALARDFDDRFVATAWTDAEGYYRLGRWADTQAENLPLARERSWRCYQAGHKADPNHNGIRRELGMPLVAAKTGDAAAVVSEDFTDGATSLRFPAPSGWRRGKALEGDATWNDPTSDTAYLSVRAIPAPIEADGLWGTLAESARGRNGFNPAGEETQASDARTVRILRWTWVDGSTTRYGATSLVSFGADQPAAVIETRGLPSDQQRLDDAAATLAAALSAP
jgi:hypothetical protein